MGRFLENLQWILADILGRYHTLLSKSKIYRNFKILKKHFINYRNEVKSYKYVCEISTSKEFNNTVSYDFNPTLKCVNDIRKLAEENYNENVSKVINEEFRRPL